MSKYDTNPSVCYIEIFQKQCNNLWKPKKGDISYYGNKHELQWNKHFHIVSTSESNPDVSTLCWRYEKVCYLKTIKYFQLKFVTIKLPANALTINNTAS